MGRERAALVREEGAERTLKASVGLVSDGVVTATGLDLVALLGAQLELAEGAVLNAVGRGIAEVVLAAEFASDLVEGFFELVELVADFDDAAAGFVGEFLHFGIARVADPAIETAIGDEEDIDDGVGFLGSFNCVLVTELAAVVFAVGQDDHGLAANLVGELVVGGQVDRVVEQRAAGIAGRNWAATQARERAASAAGIDFGFVEGGFEAMDVVGEVPGAGRR